MPSNEYQAWQSEWVHLIKSQAREALKDNDAVTLPIGCAEIEITIWFPDRRSADLTNKAESIMDLLVDAGILKDDNHLNCPKLTLRSGGVDKNYPSAHIDIMPDIAGFYADLGKNEAIKRPETHGKI